MTCPKSDCLSGLANHCRLGDLLTVCTGIVKILGSVAIVIQLASCVSQSEFTARARAAVASGENVLVLLRIQCTVDDRPHEALGPRSFMADPIVFFGLGSFDTVGEPRPVTSRFLSEESQREGWTYFLLTSGVHYLAVIGPDSSALSRSADQGFLNEAPRWRIDVPDDGRLFYAGTLHIRGKTEGKLLVGGSIIAPVGDDELVTGDDHEFGSRLLAEYFPNAGDVKTIQMQRWHPGEPVIIRTPKHKPTN